VSLSQARQRRDAARKGGYMKACASSLPETGYLRIWDILGDRRRGLPAIIPVSRSTWYLGVSEGRFPQPVKLSRRISAWRVEDIKTLIE